VSCLQLFNVINIYLHVTTSGNNESKLATKFTVSGIEIRLWHAKSIGLRYWKRWPEELTPDQSLTADVNTAGSESDLRPALEGSIACLTVIGGLQE